MENWEGKNAFIAGANSGIGAGMTKRFLENGINVYALDKDIDNLFVSIVQFILHRCVFKSREIFFDFFFDLYKGNEKRRFWRKFNHPTSKCTQTRRSRTYCKMAIRERR